MPDEPITPQEETPRAPVSRIRSDSLLFRWVIPAALAVLTGALVTIVAIVLAIVAEMIPGL
jgi:hypothetical protein